MYSMCVCLFSALSHRVGALQMFIIIIMEPPIFFYKMGDTVHSIVNPLCVFDHLFSRSPYSCYRKQVQKEVEMSSLVSLY